MRFQVRDLHTDLWVAADSQLGLPYMTWTRDKSEAQIFEGELMRDYWLSLSCEIIEV